MHVIDNVDVGEDDENRCTYGYRFFLVSCIDINECAEGTHNCNVGETCFNYDGGYRCDKVEENMYKNQHDCGRI